MAQADDGPQRVQFSSCDECRRSRVRCDAGRLRRNTDAASTQKSCTRCLNRQRECTFEWLKRRANPGTIPSRTKGRDRAGNTENDIHASDLRETTLGRSMSELSEPPGVDWTWPVRDSMQSQASLAPDELDTVTDTSWLHAIYESVFETVFGSWLGKYSNPFAFGEHSLSDMCVSVHQLCRRLDKWMDEEWESPAAMLDLGRSIDSARRERDLHIDQCLDHAIEAFAARWLPLVSQSQAQRLVPTEEIIRSLWRRAHKDMLRVINRPAYRSMLTLLLFALTPIPAGISEEEELDRVPGQVCVHAALQQIQELRANQRSLRFNGNRINLDIPARPPGTSPHSMATANFINAESTAYWVALTFDTSASLTLGCKPLLSSGLFGCESETSWRLVRACLEIFRDMTKIWHDSDFEMTDEKANQVIASGAAWKLLVWKLTANLKESLRDGHDEAEVSKAFSLVSEAIDQFNLTYRGLLEACQRRIQFFGQETKLRWYELMLHYNLSILMLVDMIAATDRHDLLTRFSAKRIDAESAVLNSLMFGLTNRYTVQIQSDDVAVTSRLSNTQIPTFTASLVAIDPYAHHAVAAVKLMQKAIDRDFASGKISADAYRSLLSTLTQTLEQLPQGSKSVQIIRADLARVEVASQPLYALNGT
ncbi:hypothetical protein PV08_08661 [Exophiala spinifera]|uniref:Zn(2)-C6 fungal-type domain-containing protein n=1 Tax=Exophiala spinifera TaxID=91928 RepID=A0A0D2B3L7_9EURO|nr:uncharacterized protein PV08_08661 [Exophiala spinifera]KIW13473.1 hypothetical protein PV08_08661 [Exophiala spinifera]